MFSFTMATMEHSDLKIPVGEHLQLQTRDGHDDRRLQVRVVGYMPGASLLVTTPKVGDKVMIMREGQPFVVRMMIGNRIVGFATTVLRSCSRPFPYLHLSYPDEMEQITVRKSQRVKVKLFASLKNDNPDYQFKKPHPATVVDLSIEGALVVSSEQLGDEGDKISLNCVFKVGAAEKLLALPAIIRNIQMGNSDEYGEGSYYHGLEFKLDGVQDTFALHGFVYEQIVKAHSE
ncbi:flagellar brake protein [Pseudomonadota bacterium]